MFELVEPFLPLSQDVIVESTTEVQSEAFEVRTKDRDRGEFGIPDVCRFVRTKSNPEIFNISLARPFSRDRETREKGEGGKGRDSLVQSYNLSSLCPTSKNNLIFSEVNARFLQTIFATLSKFEGPKSPRASTSLMYCPMTYISSLSNRVSSFFSSVPSTRVWRRVGVGGERGESNWRRRENVRINNIVVE